jgi:uncharacterized protein with GYD domain
MARAGMPPDAAEPVLGPTRSIIRASPHPGYVLPQEGPMPNYIMLVNLTDQGVRGVKDIPKRQAASREMVKKLGIERKQVFMTFGPYDFVHILEAPDDQAMAKYVLALGALGNVRTTVLKAFDEPEHNAFIASLP